MDFVVRLLLQFPNWRMNFIVSLFYMLPVYTHHLGSVFFHSQCVISCFLSVTPPRLTGCTSRPLPPPSATPAFNHTRLIKRPWSLSAACPPGFITPSPYTCSAASITVPPLHTHTLSLTRKWELTLAMAGRLRGWDRGNESQEKGWVKKDTERESESKSE